MESLEVLVNGGISNGGVIVSYGNGLEQVNGKNGLEQVGGDEKGKGNLAEEVLEDLEEYWEDINDRLMISRMVSDSVIKGMVTAVEQEAAEKIATKELEVANLKEYLQSREVGTGKYDTLTLPVVQRACEVGNYGRLSCFTDACVKHEKMREDLYALKNVAREHFIKAKKEIECARGYNSLKEIECARGYNSLKKIGSGSELVGLGGILPEKQSESWMHVDKMLECLKATVDTVCTKVDDMLLFSEVSLFESQQERDLSAKLEDIVIQSAVRSLQEEFEEKWEQNAQFCGIQNVNWLEKFNDISSLGTQLDAILKSLSLPETGLVSHGSHDLDHLHHTAFGNHVTPPTSLYGENGTLDASNIHVAEIYDFQQLKHLSKEDLVRYFNNIIIKMRRDHESALQQNTEEYFRLKRDYLKEKGSFVKHRKEEEFDVLRKKIPEVISKLEDFILENERFPALTNHVESIGTLKDRLESLLSENRQLRDCLTDKKNEVKCLEAQVSGAEEKLLQHSLAEEDMLKLMENLKSAAEDSCIEASPMEEVYKCALRELIGQMRRDSEDSNMEFLITRGIDDIRAAAIPPETTNTFEIKDSDIESLIMQELSGLLLTEAINDAGQKLHDLSISLSKEREQFELASQELHSLREHACRQETLATESKTELESLRAQNVEAFQQIDVHRMEMQELNQKLDQTKEVLAEANKERNTAFAVAQETRDKLLLSEAREEKLKEEMEMAVSGLSKTFHDFGCRVSRVIEKNSLRLEDTSSHLKVLTKMANVLRRTGLIDKQRLEQRSADLQTAEAEVDLLGDEVDAMLRLLEKIYIGLDHYSPVLKHYPGIVEILELVRRELSGESTKLS